MKCFWALLSKMLSHLYSSYTSPAVPKPLRGALYFNIKHLPGGYTKLWPWEASPEMPCHHLGNCSFKQRFAPILKNLWPEVLLPWIQHCYFSTPKARNPQIEIHGRKQKEKFTPCRYKSNQKNVQIKLLYIASVLLLQIPSLHLSTDRVLTEGFMRLKN